MSETSPVAEAPATELTPQPELVTPEAEAVAADAENTPENPDSTEQDSAAKIQARFERRFGRLSSARYQAEAAAKQAQQESEQLRQRLAQYEQQTPQDQQALTPEKVLPLAQQLAQQMRDQEKVVDSIKRVLTSGKALDGFTEACNAVNEELPFYTDKGAPTPFLSVVMECDDPAKVLHHLGRHPELASDLADLTPTQQARRLDRLESDLKKPAEPKQSAAPKPLEPVKGQGGITKDPARMSDAEFAQWRKAQIAQRH